jgi:hypothetical protein
LGDIIYTRDWVGILIFFLLLFKLLNDNRSFLMPPCLIYNPAASPGQLDVLEQELGGTLLLQEKRENEFIDETLIQFYTNLQAEELLNDTRTHCSFVLILC